MNRQIWQMAASASSSKTTKSTSTSSTKKKRPCCVCKHTKTPLDECRLKSADPSTDCQDLWRAHFQCLKDNGFVKVEPTPQ